MGKPIFVPETFVMKLFDQVKEASMSNSESINGLNSTTMELLEAINGYPADTLDKLEDLFACLSRLEMRINQICIKMKILFVSVGIAFSVVTFLFSVLFYLFRKV